MEQQPVQTAQPAQPAAQKEVHIPWYIIVGVMLVITAVIIVVFSGPLNTSPDQKYEQPAAAKK